MNNKFLDINIRLPKELGFLEKKARDLVSGTLHRGKITINITLEILPGSKDALMINRRRLNQYVQTLEQVKKELALESPVSLDHIVNNKELFEFSSEDFDEKEMQELLSDGLGKAISHLNEMRNEEGNNLEQDLRDRMEKLASGLERINSNKNDNIQQEFNRLYNNAVNLLGENKIDRQRLEQEIAIISDRVDITEECVRLESHLRLFSETLNRKDDIGKKLTFLLQEMLREANTMNSKSSDIDIQHQVIAMKEEIERMREQVQNIE